MVNFYVDVCVISIFVTFKQRNIMKLYLFNPDSDLALANNTENYMPPASARQMARDLALLPIWYAQPGSAVLAPSAYNDDFLKQMRQLFRIDVQLATPPELPDYAEAQMMPWGWNVALRKYLLKNGILERKLPTLDSLEDCRYLSSRIGATMVMAMVGFQHTDFICGAHFIAQNIVVCESLAKSLKKCVFKAPWSGSGKGLNWCRHGFTKPVANRCERVLKEQNFLIVEPIYNKVEDFAMEFYSDGQGKVVFVGYSLFQTNDRGAYAGNLLLSDQRIEEWIGQYIPLVQLINIRERVQGSLASIYGSVYTGYIGVDMMICSTNKEREYLIYPCVEVNMRMNMGLVSRLFYDNFVMPDRTGRFHIDSFATPEELHQCHERDLQEYPVVVEDGRLVSGYLPLVPITPKSRYRAYVEVLEQI